MSIKELIVEEFEVEEKDLAIEFKPGHKYSYFKDPKTGKFYRPKSSFTVTGENLETLFEEIENEG